MTTDPYPANLAELDEEPAQLPVVDPIVVALNRIAIAIERNTVALHQPVQNAPGATLQALPPVRTAPVQNAGVCPIHGTPWKVVPAGVSKKTGQPYDAFAACSTKGCDQRPPR